MNFATIFIFLFFLSRTKFLFIAYMAFSGVDRFSYIHLLSFLLVKPRSSSSYCCSHRSFRIDGNLVSPRRYSSNWIPFRKTVSPRPQQQALFLRRSPLPYLPDAAPQDETASCEYSGQAFDDLCRSFRSQQSRLTLLEQDLVKTKVTTNKLEMEVHHRFEGINRNEVITQTSCKWFAGLILIQAVVYYLYFVFRKGTMIGAQDDDAVLDWRIFYDWSDLDIMEDGIFQVSCYSMVYLFMVLWDLLWLTLFPDRVRCERTTAHTHVIVAAHRAYDSLQVMLPKVLESFRPECVWVADNGFRDEQTEELCKRLGVNYEYNPVGNKANALVVTAEKIKRLHGDVKNGEYLSFQKTFLNMIAVSLILNPVNDCYCSPIVG